MLEKMLREGWVITQMDYEPYTDFWCMSARNDITGQRIDSSANTYREAQTDLFSKAKLPEWAKESLALRDADVKAKGF